MEQTISEKYPWRTADSISPLTPDWAIGFVYTIIHTVNDIEIVYVGKKLLTQTKKKKIGVRAQAAERASRADGKSHKVMKVVTPSMWQTYWGSSKTLHAALDTRKGTWQRTIVEWCYSKKNMSYNEMKWQCQLRVMEAKSYNDHIANFYGIDTDRNKWLEWKEQRQKKQL